MRLALTGDMVAEFIKDLLYEQDQVVIPELGGLTLYYQDPRIDQSGVLQPAAKRITFDEKQKFNDSNLAAYLAHRQGISESEAQDLVRQFVFDARREMQQEGIFKLEGIGRFSIDNRYDLQFEEDQSANFLADSFGLPGVKAIEVEHDDDPLPKALKPGKTKKAPTPAVAIADSTPKKGAGIAVWLALGVLLIGGAAALYFFVLNRKPVNLAEHQQEVVVHEGDEAAAAGDETMEAASELEEPEATAEPAAETHPTAAAAAHAEKPAAPSTKAPAKATSKPVEPTPAPTPAPAPKPAKATPAVSGKSAYVIAGSFPEQAKAEQLVADLKKRGLKASLLMPAGASPNYRVSAQTYPTKEAAAAALPGLKAKTKNESLWVLMQ